MKRIFELTLKEIENMNKNQLKEIIKLSEGRTVMAENVISCQSLIGDVSNPELSASFGADMITLNTFDFNNPLILGIDDIGLDLSEGMDNYYKKLKQKSNQNKNDKNYIRKVKKIVGRFLGVNLEPVPNNVEYIEGFKLSENNLIKAKEYGFDYVVLTGNPNTGVNTKTIIHGIRKAKEILGNEVMIIAGKMHGAGEENIYDKEELEEFVKNGADVVLIPAPGTVPGFDMEISKLLIESIHNVGGLAMTAFGTSQEGAQKGIIEKIALMSKMIGADIQHIGDAGFSGMALPENIMTMSIAIRGVRHTYRRIGYSLNK